MEHLEPGATFGPYAVEGLIAGGGMGQVYAARHNVYGSVCAIKVLHEKLHKDADWRARFNEEGLVGTQLKHPHVLSARELVEHEGRVAIVMDLVKGGQTLEKVVSREFAKGLPLDRALAVFLEIVQGIDYLHGKDIVHGDLKPENVMIEGEYRRPETWHTKLTDFGTVGLIAHPVVIDGRTAVVATPRYASPEHLRGSDNLEVRSDIYCLGLILHFLLTGEHCSDARTVREAAMFVLDEVPLVHMVDQPEAVIEVFKRCTRIKPKDRYADCRELALAVREALEALGVKLELEDVKADLATEVDEERAEAQRENLSRADSPPKKREVSDTDKPTDLDEDDGGELVEAKVVSGPASPPEPDPEKSVPLSFVKGSQSEVTLDEPMEDADTGDSIVDEEGTGVLPPGTGEETVARPPPSPPKSAPISARQAPPEAGPQLAVLLPVLVGGGAVILLGGLVVWWFIL
ncbi:MAG: serine/threonine protein kinase [Alphaproteobacteria bacterium]|nr:serine/threonine protein kinase [Alphaproteobacteria bacterium]